MEGTPDLDSSAIYLEPTPDSGTDFEYHITTKTDMQPEIKAIFETTSIHLPELESPEMELQDVSFSNAVLNLSRERHGGNLPEYEIKNNAALSFKKRRFIFTRNRRALEVASPRMEALQEIKTEIFRGVRPYARHCVDGRLGANRLLGLSGRSQRTRAGDLHRGEIAPTRGKHEELTLNSRGLMAQSLREAWSKDDLVVEISDSHLHCAAQGGKEEGHHAKPLPDGGLRRDVIKKKETGKAIDRYREARYGATKQFEHIQVSSNPQTGYIFMGLERDEALNDPRAVAEGFTFLDVKDKKEGKPNRVLEQLIAENIVISVEDLVEGSDGRLKQILRDHHFVIDYEENFLDSKENFWGGMQAMLPVALPMLKEKLLQVMPELAAPEKENELHRRAVLLLSNAYSGFLYSYRDNIDERQPYAYENHQESTITITTEDRGPYPHPLAFVVDPHAEDPMKAVALTVALIRKNRSKRSLSPEELDMVEKIFDGDFDAYVHAPVLAFSFERLRENEPRANIDMLQKVDWSDLPTYTNEHGRNWMQMAPEEFADYLTLKADNVPHHIARKIENLRQKAISFYRGATDEVLVEELGDGRVIPVWVLADHNRKNEVLLPFITDLDSRYFEDSAAA